MHTSKADKAKTVTQSRVTNTTNNLNIAIMLTISNSVFSQIYLVAINARKQQQFNKTIVEKITTNSWSESPTTATVKLYYAVSSGQL